MIIETREYLEAIEVINGEFNFWSQVSDGES
jgi:hypothetical protein